MIHQIYASDKRFKRVVFMKGLNIILADRTQDSGKKDTRNGAGKTTLINIIHFCLGADLNRLSLPVDEIHDWDFLVEMDVCGKTIIAKRSIRNPKVVVLQGDTNSLPIPPEKEKGNEEVFYKNEDWKRLLGNCFFDIGGSLKEKYTPSFRSLISYFARRGADAYIDPFHHFRNQKTFDWQINNAFLLGLNWIHASESQEIREKESATKALNSAIKAGIIATQGELEATRVRLEKEIAVENKAITSFKVHPQYKELQDKANQFTNVIHSISNQLLVLRRKLERYEESVASEKAPDTGTVERLYTEAGLLFPDTIRKTLNEAKSFHESIVRNRKTFLQAEIAQIKNQISTAENEIKVNSDERATLMQLLRDHGALEEFALLQERLLEKKGQLETTKSKISDIKEMSLRKKEIKASKIELETKLQRDYEQSRPNWEKAVTLFNENSLALYDEPGNLIINTTENGYQFDVEIQRSSSEGVGKMKIFCYDLMLVELLTQRNGINFLIHDSTIYDGVDSRQRALALMHAKRKAEASGFQYICALNSDMVPYDDFDEGFDINPFVRLRLTDQNPSKSALGFHFELKKGKRGK
ncbi:MAG: DUF2326 domain-containing protein [Gammaproteobacteria bacterium]